MTAPAWWLFYRHPNGDGDWLTVRRPFTGRDQLDDARRDLRHEGFETAVEECA